MSGAAWVLVPLWIAIVVAGVWLLWPRKSAPGTPHSVKPKAERFVERAGKDGGDK